MAAPKLHHHLYVQVLVAIALGVLVGALFPTFGAQLKPLGDAFVKLVKMLIAPIIFTTVVVGIASIGDMGRLGRVGLKALIYFEAVTTLALLIGLAVVHLVRPGAGMNVDPATLDSKGIAAYTAGAQHLDTVDFLLNIIPNTVVEAFTRGDILQVLLVAILFGVAVAGMGEKGAPVIAACELVSKVFFGMVGWMMKLAPLGAFGAMAFTVGKYGMGSLVSLGWLMLSVYATCLFFVFGVLGAIARFNGFSLWRFIVYIRDELLIVLATSSSEPALPRLIAKLEALGCARPVVGLVVPTGYSFNLDGTSIYLTMAAMFVAQALNVELSWTQQATLLGLLMVTSKGAAAVTGGGFITLAATLSALPTLPVEGLTLLLGVDRFMSEARALTNLVGNGVATIVVSRWEGQFDEAQAARVLAGELPTGPAGDDLALSEPD